MPHRTPTLAYSTRIVSFINFDWQSSSQSLCQVIRICRILISWHKDEYEGYIIHELYLHPDMSRPVMSRKHVSLQYLKSLYNRWLSP